MKYILFFVFALLLYSKSVAQHNLPNNSIGLSFIQLQGSIDSWYFKLAPIFNLGISYEHKIGKNYTLGFEGIFKSGNNHVSCIDCPGAFGKMREWNIKAGVNRYFSITDKLNLFGQLQLFYEKTDVPDGKYNFSLNGKEYFDWFRKQDYRGIELSTGIEYEILNAIHLYLNPSLQFGKYDEVNSLYDLRSLVLLNFSILENVGIKYKF